MGKTFYVTTLTAYAHFEPVEVDKKFGELDQRSHVYTKKRNDIGKHFCYIINAEQAIDLLFIN